ISIAGSERSRALRSTRAQPTQLQRRPCFAVRHRWHGAIAREIERPADNRRCGFAGCAALALPSLWSGLADGAFAAAFGHGLPAIFAGNGSWIDVADRDEAAAVVFDDVKLCVFFIHIERTTEARRAAVAAIAAGACEQDPILVTGLFARILTCLIN